jgi:hypothetical protein
MGYAVPGKEQGGEQPDQHGKYEQRQRGEPARPVRRHRLFPVSRWPRRVRGRGKLGQPPVPRQIGHDLRELTECLRREGGSKTFVQLIEGQSTGRVMIAKVRRRGVAFGVPDAKRVESPGPVRVAATGEVSVIPHRHRASSACSEGSVPSTIDRGQWLREPGWLRRSISDAAAARASRHGAAGRCRR